MLAAIFVISGIMAFFSSSNFITWGYTLDHNGIDGSGDRGTGALFLIISAVLFILAPKILTPDSKIFIFIVGLITLYAGTVQAKITEMFRDTKPGFILGIIASIAYFISGIFIAISAFTPDLKLGPIFIPGIHEVGLYLMIGACVIKLVSLFGFELKTF